MKYPLHAMFLSWLALSGTGIQPGLAKTGPRQPARPVQRPAAAPTNHESDPQRLSQYDSRRARYVELRHEGRLIADLGRKAKSPLILIAAAHLIAQAPPPRRLSLSQTGADEGMFREPPANGPNRVTVDTPDPAALLAEARGLLPSPPGPLEHAMLALLDRIAQSEVIIRGDVMGPQQTCDQLSPRVKIIYQVIYEGGERAMVAISGSASGYLQIGVTDHDGNLISRATDEALVSWNPKKRGVFRIEIENHGPEKVTFCLETN